MRTKIALIGLLLAVVGGLVVAGPVAAQEQVGNETAVPGVDAGENRTVTTDLTWADGADAANDSATIEIEHVQSDGTVADTTTETVDADPGNVTTTETLLQPTEDVDEFQVNVTASDGAVDDVSVSSDASSGGGGGFIGGDGSSGAVGGVVVILVVLAIGWAWRDR